MSEPLNGAALLAQIKPKLKEEATQVCLRPDLIDRWKILNEELVELQAAGAESTRMAGSGGKSSPTKKKAQEIKALEAEIEDASVWFRFRGLPVHEYQALCSEHPPRKGNQVDIMVGFDRDGVADALVRSSLIDPVFDAESWAELMGVLDASEWDELRRAARDANGGVAAPPKSELASRVLSRRANASK